MSEIQFAEPDIKDLKELDDLNDDSKKSDPLRPEEKQEQEMGDDGPDFESCEAELMSIAGCSQLEVVSAAFTYEVTVEPDGRAYIDQSEIPDFVPEASHVDIDDRGAEHGMFARVMTGYRIEGSKNIYTFMVQNYRIAETDQPAEDIPKEEEDLLAEPLPLEQASAETVPINDETLVSNEAVSTTINFFADEIEAPAEVVTEAPVEITEVIPQTIVVPEPLPPPGWNEPVYKRIEQEIPVETVEQSADDTPPTEDQVVEVGSFWSKENQFDQEAGNNVVASAAAAEFEQATVLEEPQTIELIAPQEVAIVETTSEPMIISPTSVEENDVGIVIAEEKEPLPPPGWNESLIEVIAEAPAQIADELAYPASLDTQETINKIDEKVIQESHNKEGTTEALAVFEERIVKEPLKCEKPPIGEVPQVVRDITHETAPAAQLEKPVDDLAIDYQAERFEPQPVVDHQLKHEVSPVIVLIEPQRSFINYRIKDGGSLSVEAALSVSPIDNEVAPSSIEVTLTAEATKPLEPKKNIDSQPTPTVTQKPVETVEDNLAISYEPLPPRSIAPETAVNTEPIGIQEKLVRPVSIIENKTQPAEQALSDIPKAVSVLKVEIPAQAQMPTAEITTPTLSELPVATSEVIAVGQPESARVISEVLPPEAVPHVTLEQPEAIHQSERVIKTDTSTSLRVAPEVTHEVSSAATPEPTPVAPVILSPQPEATIHEAISRITPLETISAVTQSPASPESFVPTLPENSTPNPFATVAPIRSEGALLLPTAPLMTTEVAHTVPRPEVRPLSPEAVQDITAILETRPIVQQENSPPLFPPEIPVRNQNNVTTQPFSEVITTLEATPFGTTIEIVGPVDEDGIVQDITILEHTHDSATGEPIIQQRFFERPAAEQRKSPLPESDWEVASFADGVFTTRSEKYTDLPTVITERDLIKVAEKYEQIIVKEKRGAKNELAPPPSAKPQPALVLTVSDQTTAPPATTTASPISIRTYVAN